MLQSEVERFRAHYNEGAMRMLETWNHGLNGFQGTLDADATARMTDVATALDERLQAIRSADDLDSRARTVLLCQSTALRASVDHVKLGGVDAILDELDRLLGRLRRDTDTNNEAARHPAASE